MPRPARDSLRSDIQVVARRLFSTVGFRATSLQMIADEVPCSKAALLYHFTSKTAILDDLVAGLNDDLADLLEEFGPEPHPDVPLRLLERSVALIVGHRAAMAMQRGLEDLAEDSAMVRQVQARADQAALLLVGADPTPADRAAAHLFRHGVLGACLSMQELSDEELGTVLLEIAARIFQVPITTISPTTISPTTA